MWLVITFVVTPYYICGRLLRLWSTFITFVVVIKFEVIFCICGFYSYQMDISDVKHPMIRLLERSKAVLITLLKSVE